jgi:peptidoglycan DL-endopeptidase LytF
MDSPTMQQCPIGTFAYTIRAGDTLFALAQRYNTTVQAILNANPGLDPNFLQIGQVICIPGTTPVTCPPNTFSYRIVAGDTLFSIAQRYNTTVQAILAVNPGLNPNFLQIGQIICIPRVAPPTTCPPNSFPYTIVAGDTLFSLSIRFNTTVQAILALNPGIDPNFLQVGQVICIPRTAPVTCPPNTFSYTVVTGDTLGSIAQRFGTTVAAIIAVNPGIDPNFIRPGQIICIPRVAPPVTCPPGTFSYRIVAGDTLFSIAQRYGTTVQAILAVNPGLNPNFLQVGQIICIPRVAPPVTCPPGTFSYTIVAGDTLFSLAARYNTTVAAIIAANPGINPNFLRVGQVICIPRTAPTVCPPGTFSYRIVAGDTLFSIAQRYNTTVQAIIAVNPGINPNFLQIGQIICVPLAPVTICPPGTISYTVQRGDTFFSIALRYNTTIAALIRANPTVNPFALTVGQRICVPFRTF